MLRLNWVHIRKFRAAESDTRLEFGPGHVFLLGRNGSGKSTLLDLLAKLASCELSSFKDEREPLDLEWELERTIIGDGLDADTYVLRMRLTVEPSNVASSGDVRPTDTSLLPGSVEAKGNTWTLDGIVIPASGSAELSSFLNAHGDGKFELQEPTPLIFKYRWNSAPEFEPPVGPPSRGENGPVPEPFDVRFILRLGGYLLNRLGSEEYWGPNGYRQKSALLKLATALNEPLWRFDEALGCYGKIVDAPGAEAPIATLRTTGRGFALEFVPHDAGFLPIRPPGTPVTFPPLAVKRSAPGEERARSRLLTQMLEAVGADEIEFRPRLLEEDARGNQTCRGFDFYLRWPGGSKHRHDQLSFGQKRLIAFLWYAAVYPEVPLITDELTNGMHASWVRLIVDMLQGRQAFHAVQNPLMLDMVGPGAEDEIPRRFVLCDAGTGQESTIWRWRNPSAHEAKRLRAAWEGGFQQLSEVLQSEGLW